MVLCFVGPISSPLARLQLQELEARWSDLDRAGVRIYAVSPGTEADARDLVPRLRLRVPLVLDPGGAIAEAWGVADAGGIGASLADLWPAGLSRALAALKLGLPRRAGPHGYSAAAFLLGEDGRVRWRERARGPLSGLDLEALMDAAGVRA